MTTVHDPFLELAAAAIDFDLAPDERASLAAHLAQCEPCRGRVHALHADARAIADLPRLVLAPDGVDRVYSKVEVSGRPGLPLLRLAMIAILLLIVALAAASVGAELFRRDPSLVVIPTSPLPSDAAAPSAEPTGGATSSPDPRASANASAIPAPVAGALPVRSGSVSMTPGPDGGLYVVVNANRTRDGAQSSGVVLALLDAAGEARAGWPIALPDVTCQTPPSTAADGSVRVVCMTGVRDEPLRAFAFDPSGRLMRGWPVALSGFVESAPRTVGDTLYVIAFQDGAPDRATQVYPRETWLMAVGADGVLRTGARVHFPNALLVGTARIGLDGTAYAMEYPASEAGQPESTLVAFDLDGGRPGWPIRIPGIPSDPSFGPDGHVYVTLASPDPAFPTRGWTSSPSRILVYDRDGRSAPGGSDPIPIAAGSDRHVDMQNPFEIAAPPPPVVSRDGTVFVPSDESGRTTVFGLDQAGRVLAGWPYRQTGAPQWLGSCPGGGTGCGTERTKPAVSPANVLYLLMRTRGTTVGGSAVAITPDGWVRPGWPVELKRVGSEFWSIEIAPDGTAYVLAVEPETGTFTSATILAIAPDSTVLYRTTVIEPRP